MFVSSYSTYIDTTANKRVQNERVQGEKKSSQSFQNKLLVTPQKTLLSGNELPVNYISNYKSLNTKQQLLQEQEKSQNSDKMKFAKVSAQGNAKVAYEENSKMFSFLIKPKQTLSQMPQFHKQSPSDLMKSKESFLRETMVNTYTANDNYYRITAA